MRNTFSVHAFLMALVAATVLPILAFSGLLVWRTANDQRELLTRTARDIARATTIDINSRIDGLRSLTLAMADARTLRVDDLAGFHRRWSGVAEREGVTATLYDTTGRQLLDTSFPFGSSPPTTSGHVRRIVETGEVEISNLIREGNENPLIKISVPVWRDGKIIYILSLEIARALADVMRHQILLPEQSATLTDREGFVIYRTHEPERFIGMQGRPEFLENFGARDEGVFVARSFEDVPVYVAFTHVKPLAWVLAVLTPARSLAAPATRSLGLLLAVGMFMLLLAGLLAWTIGRAIARSVSGLTGLAATLAGTEGEDRPTPTPIREVNAVADAMRGTARALRAEIRDRRSIERQLAQAQKMHAIGQLTGGMAHDFNNLLAVVVGCLDILRERLSSDANSLGLAEEAMAAATSGAELTRQLLAFARRQPLAPERCDINAIVGGFGRLLTRTLGGDIEVDLEPADHLWPALVDRAQLEAAIMNLATNARHAMPQGGRLTIAMSNVVLDEDYAAMRMEVTPGDYVLIEMRDTGIGIPEDMLDRIFEPFFTTREPGKGTGLGLSMVFGFAKQSGGHIAVYSEVGQGTAFRLYLPRARDDAPLPDEVSLPPPQRGRDEIILVVEDNAALRRMLVVQLVTGGYRAFEAENARVALDRLEGGERIDLLLTDIVMPGGMNGRQLAQLAVLLRPDLKVVLTSGFSDAANGGEVIAPNERILRKPYRRDELLRTLRAALMD